VVGFLTSTQCEHAARSAFLKVQKGYIQVIIITSYRWSVAPSLTSCSPHNHLPPLRLVIACDSGVPAQTEAVFLEQEATCTCKQDASISRDREALSALLSRRENSRDERSVLCISSERQYVRVGCQLCQLPPSINLEGLGTGHCMYVGN